MVVVVLVVLVVVLLMVVMLVIIIMVVVVVAVVVALRIIQKACMLHFWSAHASSFPGSAARLRLLKPAFLQLYLVFCGGRAQALARGLIAA